MDDFLSKCLSIDVRNTRTAMYVCVCLCKAWELKFWHYFPMQQVILSVTPLFARCQWRLYMMNRYEISSYFIQSSLFCAEKGTPNYFSRTVHSFVFCKMTPCKMAIYNGNINVSKIPWRNTYFHRITRSHIPKKDIYIYMHCSENIPSHTF
jgi:hypothetical protein